MRIQERDPEIRKETHGDHNKDRGTVSSRDMQRLGQDKKTKILELKIWREIKIRYRILDRKANKDINIAIQR